MPVWKTKDLGRKSFYLARADDAWYIWSGPANLGNDTAFTAARKSEKLRVVWQSHGEIMNAGCLHQWGFYDTERQVWAVDCATYETVFL